MRVFKQENTFDCGVCVCQFLKHLLLNDKIPVWTKKDMSDLRIMMAWETLENHIRF